jgi:hypothetical protein
MAAADDYPYLARLADYDEQAGNALAEIDRLRVIAAIVHVAPPRQRRVDL